jgi:hypothetical protein
MRTVLLAIILLGTGTLALASTTSRLDLDPGSLAAVRTGILVTLAVAAASLSRSVRFQHASWLVYPLFTAAAIKVVLEDLPQGRPATLFASLALFGLALLAAPRLARRPGN